MTDIKRRKVAPRSLLVFLASVALVAAALGPAAQAGPPTPDHRSAANAAVDRAVGARHVAVKPKHTSIKNGFSKRDRQLWGWGSAVAVTSKHSPAPPPAPRELR